jgi:hypothetical protein
MTLKVSAVEPLLSLAVGAFMLWIAVHRPFAVPRVALCCAGCSLSEMDSPTNSAVTERNGGKEGKRKRRESQCRLVLARTTPTV